jgi:hypothetical protein
LQVLVTQSSSSSRSQAARGGEWAPVETEIVGQFEPAQDGVGVRFHTLAERRHDAQHGGGAAVGAFFGPVLGTRTRASGHY